MVLYYWDLFLDHRPYGFEVLTAVSMKIAVFWVVAPCSLVEVYQRFSSPCCLHHQGDQKTAIFIALMFLNHNVSRDGQSTGPNRVDFI
jgi:hypothetical protein